MTASGPAEIGAPVRRARVPSRDLVAAAAPTPERLKPAAGNPLAGVDVALAPLCGVTDSIFRRICLDRGADMVTTEMISAEGLVRNSENIRSLANVDMSEGPLVLQIFGADPEAMGESAAILSDLQPRMLDMNFGCPVRKIVTKNGGSAVLRDAKLLHRICKRVVERSSVPVSAKIRSGWDKSTASDLQEIGRAIEDAGVSVVAIHARTKKQAFQGKANWELIRILKDAVSIPVVGNGDVVDADSYFRIKEQTDCDAVMIGRAAIGNPWVFEEIHAAIDGREFAPPTPQDRVQALLNHVRLAVNDLGEPTGLVLTRKVMLAYLKRLRNARDLRGKLMTCVRLSDLEDTLARYLERLDNEAEVSPVEIHGDNEAFEQATC